jgi:hypothetical protein
MLTKLLARQMLMQLLDDLNLRLVYGGLGRVQQPPPHPRRRHPNTLKTVMQVLPSHLPLLQGEDDLEPWGRPTRFSFIR